LNTVLCITLHLHTSTFSFFFHHPATTQIYTLSLHDALPISRPARRPDSRLLRHPGGPPPGGPRHQRLHPQPADPEGRVRGAQPGDRKSTRLNSSHLGISYAVFCLKKKKKNHGKSGIEGGSTEHAHRRECIESVKDAVRKTVADALKSSQARVTIRRGTW